MNNLSREEEFLVKFQKNIAFSFCNPILFSNWETPNEHEFECYNFAVQNLKTCTTPSKSELIFFASVIDESSILSIVPKEVLFTILYLVREVPFPAFVDMNQFQWCKEANYSKFSRSYELPVFCPLKKNTREIRGQSFRKNGMDWMLEY